ncbi:hypothetical protein ACR79N_26735 [Sphingobacterium siyangense]|uniref:hypothetical protein n=1 Tax=Sphingobacterium siyangense TaxID=459529 RepID=UPI003DA4B4C8
MKPSIDNYKDLITEVKNQQNKDGVRNYFPWFKLSQTLISKIDQLSENLVDSATYLSFKEYLQLFTNVVSKFEETYEWSYTKKLIPIQMPFNECQSDYIINADGYKAYKLFFFTAFFLPLDYEELNKSKNFLNLKKVKYETLSSVYDKLQYVVEDVKEASEKMRKQERRSIEILAIFSAVALFSVV